MEEPISPSHTEKTQNLQNKQDPLSLFLDNFQNKAIFFAIFIVLLPFFTSKAPDIVQQALSNRIWELFHLLLVGIAVSYGLFSRKLTDQETEKEITPKPDNSENYITEILDTLPIFYSNELTSPKFQAWSSVYNPNEPLVVVENDNTNGNSENTNKPLFLPIRSLKPIINEPESIEEEELFPKHRDYEASDLTDGEEKGDFDNYLRLRSQSEKFNFNSELIPSKNKKIRSLSMKESSKGGKINPNNFKCEHKGSKLTENKDRTVKSENNSLDELIKALEEDSESDESDENSYGFEKNESCNEEETSSCLTDDGYEENEDNEVDKKADEFIAKFREQIRKQRIQGKKKFVK